MKNVFELPSDFSLLWRDYTTKQAAQPNSFLRTDLNLNFLVRALSMSTSDEATVRSVLLALNTDSETITYRQAILADLLNNPDLTERLVNILEQIQLLDNYLITPRYKENPLQQLAWRLGELQRYVEIVTEFYETLMQAGGRLSSDGLKTLRNLIRNLYESDILKELREELPQLLPRVRSIRSITIGLNLNAELKPLAVTLLDVHTEPFTGTNFMTRFFNRETETDMQSKQRLHTLHPEILRDNSTLARVNSGENAPRFLQLMLDLAQITSDISEPIVQDLRKYTRVHSRFLLALKDDLAFYLGAVGLMTKIKQAGLPLCQPEILPVEAREMHLESLYNINLCIQRILNTDGDAGHIVGNDAHFDDEGRIFILTGPNQGGKTTYTQAIGLAQILAQAGLHVPAKSARLSPVDGIYTHFATEENASLEAGRLGEEARRLHEIFASVTRHSLVLLNESLASTSATESLMLARDVVRALRLSGVRGIFATHLHELASDADELNQETDGESHIISVVSQVITGENNGNTIQRTYVIKPGPPNNRSYALELAAKYGISYEQLREMLAKRNLAD